jgi:ariadne-1
VLSWTYPFVYYMDPVRDRKKIELCDQIHGVAEKSLEKLHKCVETEWKELKGTAAVPGAEFDAASAAEFAAAFKEYMLKLFVLDTATRNHLKKLVEGFESGLPEFKVTL